jgi:hypothetical protein
VGLRKQGEFIAGLEKISEYGVDGMIGHNHFDYSFFLRLPGSAK